MLLASPVLKDTTRCCFRVAPKDKQALGRLICPLLSFPEHPQRQERASQPVLVVASFRAKCEARAPTSRGPYSSQESFCAVTWMPVQIALAGPVPGFASLRVPQLSIDC